MINIKYCPHCQKNKPIIAWGKDKKRRDGLSSWCKDCMNKSARDVYKDSPHRYTNTRKMYAKNHQKEQALRSRKSHLKHRVDIDLDEYNKLLKAQKGICLICGKPETIKHKSGSAHSLSVDHNHNTGKTRGLLCRKCNTALGYLDVDNFGILNLQKAIQYLGH